LIVLRITVVLGLMILAGHTRSLLRSFDDFGGKTKFCVNCGNMVTQEAYSEDMAYPQRNTVTHVQK
jgi:hypothetical protein